MIPWLFRYDGSEGLRPAKLGEGYRVALRLPMLREANASNRDAFVAFCPRRRAVHASIQRCRADHALGMRSESLSETRQIRYFKRRSRVPGLQRRGGVAGTRSGDCSRTRVKGLSRDLPTAGKAQIENCIRNVFGERYTTQ